MAMHGRVRRTSSPRRQHYSQYSTANFEGSVDGPPAPTPARAEKKGGLRALVSKFENLASSNNKPVDRPKRQVNALGTKGRGWRGAVGLGKKDSHTQVENVEGPVIRIDSLEVAWSTRAKEIKLETKVIKQTKGSSQEDSSQNSIKSQSSLIVRGKKEGRRWLNGLSGKMSRENKDKGGSEGSRSKKSSRRESLVQLRIRALETAKGQRNKTSTLVEEGSSEAGVPPLAHAPNGGSNNLTPTTTHTQESSGDRSGRERAKLRKAPPPVSTKPAKGSNLPSRKSVTGPGVPIGPSSTISNTNQAKEEKRAVLRKKNPSETNRRSEISTESAHDNKAHQRTHRPSEAQVFSLAARSEHGMPRKSIGPTIRERIHMFEAAKDMKGTSVVALLGAGATAALKSRIAYEGAEDGAEVKDIMRTVQYGRSEEKLTSPQDVKIEGPSLTRGSTEKKKERGPVSRYLQERKRSNASRRSPDAKVNGKYVSAFAGKRSGQTSIVTSPGTTKGVLQAVVKATTPKKTSQTMTNSKSEPRLGKSQNGPPLTSTFSSPSLWQEPERHALSKATSLNTSPARSLDGHSDISISKRNHRDSQALLSPMSPVCAVGNKPLRPGLSDVITPPSAPMGTPPGTIDSRVAELIELAAEDEGPIISKGVAEDYTEIARLGSALGGMKEVPVGGSFHPSNQGAVMPAQVVRNAQMRTAPKIRTPLSRNRSRSSMVRMLGRDGAMTDNGEDEKATSQGRPNPMTHHNSSQSIQQENGKGEKDRDKENVPSDEEKRSERSERGEKGFEDVLEGEQLVVVRSLVEITEPKPLRLTEVSRMLRMCRFGRSRSGGRLSGDIKF